MTSVNGQSLGRKKKNEILLFHILNMLSFLIHCYTVASISFEIQPLDLSCANYISPITPSSLEHDLTLADILSKNKPLWTLVCG